MHQPIQPSRDHQDIRPGCNHIFPPTSSAPARFCGSPALRGESFCFYHHPTRTRISNPNERRARRIARQSFAIPAPTDRYQLNLALDDLTRRIAANQIDLRRAGLILFALQTPAKTL